MVAVENFAADGSVAIAIQITTANSARDGSGTIVTALTPGTAPASANGLNVSKIVGKANGTLSSGCQVVVYKKNGSTWIAVGEFSIASATASNTVASGSGSITFADLTQGIPGTTIPNGSALGFSATQLPTGPTTPAINIDIYAANY